MNIFDQYGIKEVADCTLYSIHKKNDGSGDTYCVPALRLDTLKISSLEKGGETIWAEGGAGNSPLIAWDYGKSITLRLEDALCSPASLGLCWGGILSSDWKDGRVENITANNFETLQRLTTITKKIYPKYNDSSIKIGHLLPLKDDDLETVNNIPISSKILDETIIQGNGSVNNRPYRWRALIKSKTKTFSIIPDRFFDVKGGVYSIDWKKDITIVNFPTYWNYKNAIIYSINNRCDTNNFPENSNKRKVYNTILGKSLTGYLQNLSTTSMNDANLGLVGNHYGDNCKENFKEKIQKTEYLAIVIDNNNNYHAFVGMRHYLNQNDQLNNIFWYNSTVPIETTLFKNLDLFIQFENMNTLIHFILTKYKDEILSIGKIRRTYENEEEFLEDNTIGKLWCFLRPQDLTPYSDDYWLHQGEPYYLEKIVLGDNNKQIRSKRIKISANQWPGMYKLVGETYIRSRDTGKDQKIQLVFPLCKVKSEHSIELEADGEPVIFNLELEVARPKNGIMMELISYEINEQENYFNKKENSQNYNISINDKDKFKEEITSSVNRIVNDIAMDVITVPKHEEEIIKKNL